LQGFKTDDEELAWFIGLVEGEGSLFVRADGRPGFSLKMTDRDVILKAQGLLGSWGISVSVRESQSTTPKLDGSLRKLAWKIETGNADYLQVIISMCYPYFSTKKQDDSLRVLDALKNRGLLESR